MFAFEISFQSVYVARCLTPSQAYASIKATSMNDCYNFYRFIEIFLSTLFWRVSGYWLLVVVSRGNHVSGRRTGSGIT